MNKSEYDQKIINLQKTKNFKEALLLVDDALLIYPQDLFFVKSKIYILSRLNNYKEAYDLAVKYFDMLKNDNFFLKSYILILERLKLTQDIVNLTKDYLLKNNILDEGNYIEIYNILSKIGEKELANDLLNLGLYNFKDSNKLAEQIKKNTNENNALEYNQIKNKFKDLDTKDAIFEIENMMTLEKYHLNVNLNLFLADLYKKTEDFDKAIDIYKHILSIKDNLFTRKMLGYVYYKKDDYHNAIIYLKDVFLKEPNDTILLSTITKIYSTIFDKNKYQELLNEAMSLNPDAKNLYGHIKKASKWKN